MKLRRIVSLLGCDRNPLRRPVDKLESAVAAALVVAFLIAAPLVGIFAGRLADSAALRELHAERTWRQVPAILRENAASGSIGVGGDLDAAWVKAQWTAPSGALRSGFIATALNAQAGSTQMVWVTPQGQLTHEPLSGIGVRDRVALSVLAAVFGLALLLVLLGGCARMAANRRRMAGWARAWEQTGPRWSQLR
jgi:hypothetical protein